VEGLRAALKNDPTITLDVAALDLARIEYPELVAERYLAALDDIAASVEACLGPARDGARFVSAVNYILFERLDFRGNEAEY